MLNKFLPPSSPIQPKKTAPVAPPVYRPQPTPRVLQTKQAVHKGPIANAFRIPSAAPRAIVPGTPAVKPVAPPVYKPNPGQHVLQRKVVQPAKPPAATPALVRRAFERGAAGITQQSRPGQRPAAQMKARAAAPPPYANPGTSVVQRVVVIREFGTKKEKRTFNVKKSKSSSTYYRSADRLIDAFQDKGLKRGWVGHVRKIVGETTKHKFNTLKDLLAEIAKTYPLVDENKKRKREEKNKILKSHQTNLDNVDNKLAHPGKKMRVGSFVGMNKLNEGLFNSKVFEQNVQDLTDDYTETETGGRSLKLKTGNIFQSQFALSKAPLNDNVMGAYLEGNYYRVNDGTGDSEGIRKNPFTEISTRDKRTVVYGEGAYKPGHTVSKDLSTFENIRLGENSTPFIFRHMLVEEGKLDSKDEFDPIGKYALSEIPRATKGEKQNNQLMDQNTYRIFEQFQQLDRSMVIGSNVGELPEGTHTATIGSYLDSYNNVTTNHNQVTQNEFHKQNFYIVRSTFGPFKDKKKKKFVPKTPPGSPFNSGYDYESKL
jgi:hypothetical protein